MIPITTIAFHSGRHLGRNGGPSILRRSNNLTWRFRSRSVPPSIESTLTCPSPSQRSVQCDHRPPHSNNIKEHQRRYKHHICRDDSVNSKLFTDLPPRMTISRAARLLRTQTLTSQQLCQHFHNLALFGDASLRLNAYAKILPLNEILDQARKSEERIRNGTAKSFLDGIPVTIKANIAVGKYWEMPNACSAILSRGDVGNNGAMNFSEGDGDTLEKNIVYESDIAKRLLTDCGAILIGITNMDEFGMGSLGINNGLHPEGSMQQNTAPQKQYSPTYNPLPWMQRLSLLLESEHQHSTIDDEEDDDYWRKQILSSTPENPHGIEDEIALQNLLREVQFWVDGNTKKMSDFVPSPHPSSPLLSPGGSSSGAAASTAHGSSLLSIGTDTGGSLRLPSAWTSTVGFKPSYGTWSRYGVVSYASSLDTVGFIAGTVECAEIAWRCLGNAGSGDGRGGEHTGQWSGRLGRDSTAWVYHGLDKVGSDHDQHQQSHSEQELLKHQSLAAAVSKPLKNIRIGIPSAFSLQELPPLIADVWSDSANRLQNFGGATLVPISESQLSSEWIKLSLASYYVLACAEASSNLSRYDGVRYGMELDLDQYSESIDSMNGTDFESLIDMTALEQRISATRAYGFGEEIQRRVLAGTSVLSSDRFHTHYEAAAVVRAKLSRSLASAFRCSHISHTARVKDEKVDAMLVPTALSFPCKLNPLHGDGLADEIDPTAAFANDVMTIPISLGGFPSVSVPVKENIIDSTGCNPDSAQIGMQVFADRGSETLVLRVANALQ